MKRNTWKVQELKKALREADKGEFISHASIQKWIDSMNTDNELSPPSTDIF